MTVPPPSSRMAMSAVMAVLPVSPSFAVPAWRAGGAARTRRAGRTGGTGLDEVSLEVHVLRLQIVELRLVGDDGGHLRDEHEDQHGAGHQGPPRSTLRFVYVAHIIPHGACRPMAGHGIECLAGAQCCGSSQVAVRDSERPVRSGNG